MFACQKMTKKKQNQFLLSNAFNASEVNNMEVLEHFVTQRIDKVPNFIYRIFRTFCPKMYIRKYLKQCST